ncbi:MAG: alpha/beta hydrolase [Candidatus Binatus sp.]|uniref:alpha/beta hydrolase n=1 Tax=Candidatus Binatus sp. TaxID=2811406 RepID=UPI002721AAE6|nr:alpha/beta hydrolase [Candidatus Binatus sp.]MDO8431579.1 alpha/beta hydrolase [Candidatus Binatus sp.]
MASEQLKKVIEIITSQPRNPNASVERRRAAMEKISERVAPDVKCEPVIAGGVSAEWVEAPDAEPGRVILYLHGGGYVTGSIITHRAMVARIARASKARALLLDYRLAPEHPFPAAVDDATAAYRWLLAQGFAPKKIVIAGDSAGGGLALATLAALSKSNDLMPAAAVPISPWTDLEGTGESIKTRAAKDPMVQGTDLAPMAQMYYGTQDPKNPLISPLHADYRGFPPLLIQVGDAEVLLDDSTRVAKRATAAGVKTELEVWDDMVHVWHVFAKLLPEGQQAIDKIGQFVIAHTS